MGEIIQLWFNNEELKILVEKFGTDNKKELAKLMKEYVLSETDNQIQNLDDKIKQLRARRLDAQCRIDEQRAIYYETFHAPPSPQAEIVIKKHADQREFTNQEFENVKKYITLKNHNFKWQATCDICKQGETYDTYKESIDDMIRHLTTEHAKKVMEMR